MLKNYFAIDCSSRKKCTIKAHQIFKSKICKRKLRYSKATVIHNTSCAKSKKNGLVRNSNCAKAGKKPCAQIAQVAIYFAKCQLCSYLYIEEFFYSQFLKLMGYSPVGLARINHKCNTVTSTSKNTQEVYHM